QALFGAVEVVELPLQLALCDPAEVERIACLPAMLGLVAPRLLCLLALLLHIVAGSAGVVPQVGNNAVADDRRQQHENDRGRRHGPAAGPLPDVLEHPNRPRLDRLPLAEASQIIGEFLGRRVTATRILGGTLEANRLEVARQVAAEGTWTHRVVV